MPALTISGSPTVNGDSTVTIDSTGADQVSAPKSVLNETQAWFAMRIVNPAVEDGVLHHGLAWTFDTSNMIRFYLGETAQGGQWRLNRLVGGADGEAVTGSGTPGENATVIACWGAFTTAISYNGEAFITEPNTAIPDLSSAPLFDIGQIAADHHLGTKMYWAAAGTGVLSDADAATLNGFGNTDPTFGALPGTPTFLWTCTDFNYTTSSPASAPTAPQSLSATAGNGQVVLNWFAPASNGGFTITGYKIYRGTTPGGETLLASPSGTATTYTNTPATNGTTYYYKVSAVNAIGESVLSNEASATPTVGATAPTAPQSLGSTPGDAQVALSWSAPSSNGGSAVTGYKVYRSLSTGTETLLASPVGTGTTYTDSTTANGTTYFYKVSAVNAIGESVLSNETSATPMAVAPSTPVRTFKRMYGPTLLPSSAATLYTCPAAATAVIRHIHVSNPSASPVNFTLSIGTSTAATRLWDAIPIAPDDVLDHYQDHVLAGGEIIQGFAGIATTLNLLVDGYELVAAGAPPTVPTAPQSLTATAGSNQIVLNWSPPVSSGGSPVTAYKIYRSTTTGAEVLFASPVGTSATYTDSTAVNGTTYFYKVAADNAVGTSALSNEASATPASGPIYPSNTLFPSNTSP